MISRLERIQGALIGFAIGDAMGATTEFMTKEQIKSQYGVVDNIIGGGWLNLKRGQVTDDTQMMLCIIDAILEPDEYNFDMPFKFDEIKENFIKWYDSKPKDVGCQCAKAINDMKIYGSIIMEKDDGALGNGGLMRALPYALLNSETANLLQCRMTHNNVTQDRYIKIYTEDVMAYLGEGPKWVHNAPYKMQPSGHVRNTCCNAIHYGNGNYTFKEAIIGAVNDGGDADTIAALTGSLSGLRYGINGIPREWIDRLDGKVVLKLIEFSYFVENYLKNLFTNGK